jgi:bacillithiol system protein YtxJ
MPGDVHIIDVASHSALGRVVQSRTGIRHESPQAIVLRDGQPTWHASHGRIRLASLQEALRTG